jgi:hypothetical protein
VHQHFRSGDGDSTQLLLETHMLHPLSVSALHTRDLELGFLRQAEQLAMQTQERERALLGVAFGRYWNRLSVAHPHERRVSRPLGNRDIDRPAGGLFDQLSLPLHLHATIIRRSAQDFPRGQSSDDDNHRQEPKIPHLPHLISVYACRHLFLLPDRIHATANEFRAVHDPYIRSIGNTDRRLHAFSHCTGAAQECARSLQKRTQSR